MNIAYLLKLIQLAGTKLPQIWPHLLHIASDVQEIVKIIGGITPPVFMASPKTNEAYDAIVECGIDADEAQSVVQIFSSAEAAGL